ncbi:Cystathionine beta-synthase, core [Corchorus capsularis]|uniref:Cystathionine beta-synthase, core n=1 Tax=Corchorus capsularis TaxID=210143 RepID=A0A1R3HVD1_COCAP|nr:Cystathionine beta-synthase, core [Corchorus capsularis]
MQETTRADLRQLEEVMKETTPTADHGEKNPEKDSATALQVFLDRIPISSIPGIKNSPGIAVELKTGDYVKDAIELLYTKNAFGAPIAEDLDPDTTVGRFLDRYIGFIDFATMFLWSLEKCEKGCVPTAHAIASDEETVKGSFLNLLERNPDIGQTKNAVIQLLLQSDGLAWFDNIAEKPLSEFRFENEENASCVYGDESIAKALHILFKSQIGAIAVISKQTQRLIGSVRSSDVYLLMENDKLFQNREVLTVEEFIHMETRNLDSDPTIERDIGALLSAGALHLQNSFLPRMDSPVSNKKTDTLKQAMKNVAGTKSNFVFLVDHLQRPVGVLTLRDIILQFAPPSMDSNIQGGGFFESALEQTGCHVKNGTLVRDH